MKTLNYIGGAILIVLLLFLGLYVYTMPEEEPIGSVSQAHEYQRTTATSSSYINPVIKTGTGALGSYVVTLLGTGSLTLYDATTTDVTKRVKATSTLPVLAYFPPSLAAGTYTFDTTFFDGLVAVWGTGTIASSSITWR